MPFATNGTTRIYYEVEGNGPPLVLYHGTTQWSGIWRSLGYVDALKDDYQLMLIDSRGHGRSSKPTDGDYSFEAQASDVVVVLGDCGIETTHFFGYSTGGLVGYQLGVHYSSRMRSLIIGGAQPYAQPAEAKEMLAGFATMIEQGLERLVTTREQFEGVLPTGVRENLLASDPVVFLGYIDYEANTDGLTDEELVDVTAPTLIYGGDNDEPFAGPLARRSAEVMANARFVEIPDADHLAAQARVDLILPIVTDFLREVDDR
jgi:pimeloyl-ACP methyl ester carboxylesterase